MTDRVTDNTHYSDPQNNIVVFRQNESRTLIDYQHRGIAVFQQKSSKVSICRVVLENTTPENNNTRVYDLSKNEEK